MMLALCLAALASQAERKIEVVADPRTILMTTAVWLATDGKFYGKPVDPDYLEAVRAHFGAHREHAALKAASALHRRGFSFDAPVGWILHYSDPPALEEMVPPGEEYVRRAGSKRALDDLAGALRTFVRDADFAGFMEKQKAAHAASAARVSKVLDAEGAVKRLEAFFGETRDAYTLTIAPLIGPHNYGPHVGRRVYQVFNPAAYADEESLRRGVADMVWHEFGHSFVNPRVDAMKDRVDATAVLFEPVRDAMSRQAYKTWETCVREHVVRAAAARLVRGERGDRAAREQAAEDAARGFRYLPPLYRALEAYEGDRKKHPSFADFVPRLMDELEGVAKEGAAAYWERQPFAGRINDVWREHRERLVFVSPPEEAKAVARRISPAPRIVTDREALEMEPGKHVFVVYGTTDSNAFLSKIADRLPFRIERDGILVDGERIAGDALRLIAAVPNPAEPRLPMVVYTATREELLAGIQGVFHGPSAYVVAGRDGQPAHKGFFPLK